MICIKIYFPRLHICNSNKCPNNCKKYYWWGKRIYHKNINAFNKYYNRLFVDILHYSFINTYRAIRFFVNVICNNFFSCLFYLVTKNKITSLGKERQKVELSRLKEIQESFKIFREIKLMALEDFFIKKFNLYNSKIYKLFKTEALIVSLPKFFLN